MSAVIFLWMINKQHRDQDYFLLRLFGLLNHLELLVMPAARQSMVRRGNAALAGMKKPFPLSMELQ